jgi:hypothetical protein
LVREPEARQILSSILECANINFCIEVPTRRKYAISGIIPDRANVDLVIEPGATQVNVEFKEGQPAEHSIQKDFMKLRCEPCAGSAFFHVLQRSNKGTMPSLLRKYASAYNHSIMDDQTSKWFTLFICIMEQRRSYWRTFTDVTGVPIEEFDPSSFCQGARDL